MQVKMKVFYNDKSNHFRPEQVVEVGQELGEYLVMHRKAVEIVKEPRRLNVEPQFEQAEEPPKFEKPQKRSRRAKK